MDSWVVLPWQPKINALQSRQLTFCEKYCLWNTVGLQIQIMMAKSTLMYRIKKHAK